ncbi:MAG TPA: SRPBCC family protein [Polyangiaceae bacterium]|nr:SRPBCC family protein [Polyangiaceae bacterium]
MKKLLRSIEINAPVESVYEFVTTPSNLPSIWPSLVAVTNVERKADGSNSFDWTYKMAGVHFHGRAKPVEAKPNRLIVTRTEEGIPSTFRWTFEPKGAGTLLTLEVEYTLPTPIIGPIAEAVLAKMNERELETLLANAKSTLESARRVQPSAPAMAH